MPNVISLSGRATPTKTWRGHAVAVAARLSPSRRESFWPQLERPAEGRAVIAPDHRGFGGSALGEGVSTMEAMAEDALALLDALKLPAAVVGGVSMGGYVAIALARLDPGGCAGWC